MTRFSLHEDLLEENAETHASRLRSGPVENKFQLVNQLEGEGARWVSEKSAARQFLQVYLLAPSDPLFEPWQRFNRSDKPLWQQFWLLQWVKAVLQYWNL